ncbi:unnamed protein product [Protopolystoma xenopodis]|uniref:Uncharacterized protein n=1 Tax=Protopolystoma xenopodis TaxID=117903 RepID=A0A3S5FCG1_9PLAT|nr:unnamed protein product [Protopolystoma xenopodis]
MSHLERGCDANFAKLQCATNKRHTPAVAQFGLDQQGRGPQTIWETGIYVLVCRLVLPASVFLDYGKERE